MNRLFKKIMAAMLASAMLFALCACAAKPAPTETTTAAAVETVSESNTEVTEAPAETGETGTAPVENELAGSPWVDSLLTGNLPEEAPEAKDDLFLHYNFDILMAHQGEMYSELLSHPSEVQDYVSSVLGAGALKASEGGTYTDAELAQLNILFEQAADPETLANDGISRIQPYLDMVNNAGTLEELNRVLVSEDFPFSPFLYLPVSAYDMSGVNNVFVYPEFIFVDNVEGANYYQDSDDPMVAQANMQMISSAIVSVLIDLGWVTESQEDANMKTQEILNFERNYGKDAGATNVYLKQEYGVFGAAVENLSLDELTALCPNYPVKETLEKFGKINSPFYSVLSKKWLETFNTMWTEENLDTIKLVITAKILHECESYLDIRVTNAVRAMSGLQPLDAQANAANVINQNKTFAQLLAKIYIADNYDDGDVARLTTLTYDLIGSFKKLIDKTTWLSDSSREKMLLKLDEMHMNILSPEGGYIDFSNLTLTPAQEGGSLVTNYLALKAYVEGKINERIGQPAQARMAWEHFTPSTVNCFYDQDNNSINILPGFLATGMYTRDMSEEELLGGIGWVIGHEISHGFDFAGSQYDAYGTGNSLFGEEDLKEYLARVDKVVAYYDTLEPLPGVYVIGNLVKVEAAADLIGLQLVLETAKGTDGLDYEKFFGRTANIYAQVLPSPDIVQMYVGGDGHPLNYLRTNVNVQMYDELYDTFGIQEGDGMYLPKEQRIHFWGE